MNCEKKTLSDPSPSERLWPLNKTNACQVFGLMCSAVLPHCGLPQHTWGGAYQHVHAGTALLQLTKCARCRKMKDHLEEYAIDGRRKGEKG